MNLYQRPNKITLIFFRDIKQYIKKLKIGQKLAVGFGTKEADADRRSPIGLEIIQYETECSVAPGICVEILLESTSDVKKW